MEEDGHTLDHSASVSPSPSPLPKPSPSPSPSPSSSSSPKLPQECSLSRVAPPPGSAMALQPLASYTVVNPAAADSEEDIPGPRCSHSLTAVVAVGDENTPGYIGPRLILFGGATSIEDGSSGPTSHSIGAGAGIRLAGVTNAVHCYDVLGKKWTRLHPAGEPPSPRAAHGATAVGTMVVIQGGIGPAGHSTEDLYVLDLTHAKIKWHRVVVQGPGPGPRYGHVLALVAQKYLIAIGGNDGRRALSDAWALDTATKPYAWRKLDPEGDGPPPCMYATASARSDGLLVLLGGRDTNGMPLSDAYTLTKHRDGRWEWSLAPGVPPSPRYQHAAVFVNSRLEVTGGTLRGGRMVEGPASAAVLDTKVAVWIDKSGVVTAPRPARTSCDGSNGDASVDLTKRCRHAATAIDNRVFLYGGLRGDVLLDDLVVAEELTGTGAPTERYEDNYRILNKARSMENTAPTVGNGVSENAISGTQSSRMGRDIDALVEASAAEAKAICQTLEAAKAAIGNSANGGIDYFMHEQDQGTGDDSLKVSEMTAMHKQSSATDVRIHHKAVVVAQDAGGALGNLVRQLSLDQFENEGRRVSYGSGDGSTGPNRLLDRQISVRSLHKRIISELLLPRGWRPPIRRHFFMDANDVSELCDTAEQIFAQEPSVLKLKAPVKIFGDLHGQFGDLMRLFDEYGFPSTAGDITYIDYLFLGDYVDRGQHSLETISLLLALKIEHPDHVHLIRGNHEAADINALFGFRIECIERMGESDGIWAWHRFNRLFNWLPLAALIEDKIICMHGGIGRSIDYVSQIQNLPRPITMDVGSIILMDLLWSDPTENDSIEGLRPNARGPGLVTFGPDRVMAFCRNNNLQMIIRAHECVMDGFERFAQGHLITLFSATNYCGTANNAGAILVLGRDLVVVPKLIHPLPPAIVSLESTADRFEDVWMQELNVQRPPTPTRGRPHSSSDRNSLAWI